jgi:hypothetical protein
VLGDSLVNEETKETKRTPAERERETFSVYIRCVCIQTEEDEKDVLQGVEDEKHKAALLSSSYTLDFWISYRAHENRETTSHHHGWKESNFAAALSLTLSPNYNITVEDYYIDGRRGGWHTQTGS